MTCPETAPTGQSTSNFSYEQTSLRALRIFTKIICPVCGSRPGMACSPSDTQSRYGGPALTHPERYDAFDAFKAGTRDRLRDRPVTLHEPGDVVRVWPSPSPMKSSAEKLAEVEARRAARSGLDCMVIEDFDAFFAGLAT